LKSIYWMVLHVLFISTAQGSTFSFRRKEIPNMPGRATDELWIHVQGEVPKSTSFKVLGKREAITQEKWSRNFNGQDFEHCETQVCSLKVLDLPYNLKSASCFLDLEIVHENKTEKHRISWGECKEIGAKPHERYLPDIQVEDFTSLESLTISNLGYGFNEKRFSLLMYLEDKEGKPIFSFVEIPLNYLYHKTTLLK